MLEPQHRVAIQLLGVGEQNLDSSGVLMVDADLRHGDRVEQLRLVMQELSSVSEKLFVVQNHVRSMIMQAYALGATSVVSRPREIVSKLAQIEAAAKVKQADLGVTFPQIAASAAVFASLFSAVGLVNRSTCRKPNAPHPPSSTASRKTGSRRGSMMSAGIMRARFSIAFW